MYELGVVYRNLNRADRAATDQLARFGASTVHEAQGRVGLLKPYMRPIYAGARISGTAVTVLLHPGDNWMLHVVAEQIQPGDVVVAALTSENTDGFFGDLLATSFRARGALGLVIDVENILFGSEMVGAVRGIDPETGNYYDDTKRYIEASTILTGDDRWKVYEGNARRVYPRLDAALKKKGK